MSDATQAEPTKVSCYDRIWSAKLTKFERLHRDYLAARAAYADPDGPDDDEVKAPLSEKQDAAELALLVQPAPATWGIWVKWEILDRLVTTDAEDGHYYENRIIITTRTVSSSPSAPSRPTSSGSG
jgi:hypothetical protein